MIVFLLLAGLLVAGALLWLLLPLLRGARARAGLRQSETALAVLREQRAELDAELAAGRIGADEHARRRGELERRALDEGRVEERAGATDPARRWALAVALAVPLAGAALYLALGNPAGLDPARTMAAQQTNDGPAHEQIAAMVDKLAQRLEQEPDNVEGWAMLARSYLVLNDFAHAEKAYARLAGLRPDDPDILADWADVSAAMAGGKLAGKPEELIARTLALAPDHPKGLALAGSAAFERGDYATAVARWEQLLAHLPPGDADFAAAVRDSVAEARAKGGLPAAPNGAAPAVSAAPNSAAPAMPAAPFAGGGAGPVAGAGAGGGTGGTIGAAASGVTLTAEVKLAPALAARADPAATVFVFVRAPDARMPIASLRARVADLPLKVDFATVAPMVAGAPVPLQVVVGARISARGEALPAPGDLEGYSPVVARDARNVALQIDRVRE